MRERERGRESTHNSSSSTVVELRGAYLVKMASALAGVELLVARHGHVERVERRDAQLLAIRRHARVVRW